MRPARWGPPRGRVLVLSPHPDDETIGCGGTLFLHHRQGDPIKTVFVTDGMAGDPRGHYRARDYRAIRQREARRAASVLGIDALEFWDYPDGALARSDGLADRLKELLEKERPDIVYRPSANDPHRDHRALAAGFEKAARRAGVALWDCQYEIWAMVRPSGVADISSAFAKKMAALRNYRSQLRYCDFRNKMIKLSTCRALFLGEARYGEAFALKFQAKSSTARGNVPR